MDTGHAERSSDVDLLDERVSVGATEVCAPEHPRRLEIARVRELAGHLRDPVDPAEALADSPELKLGPEAVIGVPRSRAAAGRHEVARLPAQSARHTRAVRRYAVA